MTIRAVLFDFSGTLARLEENDTWFAGMDLDDAMQALVMDRMLAPTGTANHHRWDHRDLDPALHREVYLHVLQETGLPDEHAESVYQRTIDPAEWQVYPDTVGVLSALRDKGIRTAVVSNIAWDIRAVLAAAGAEADEIVLSYEVGAAKPDPAIFAAALSRLGVAAEDALMVGDSPENDGAAEQLGCSFVLVDPLPIAERPTGLVEALRSAGVDL